jgi:SNF2 family DNA or RNA helicase
MAKEELKLYGYQHEGASFLLQHARCLLADEMGLGKTVQTIAALKCIELNRVLIICPNSMKLVWQQEMTKWNADATVVVIDGTRSQRLQQLKSSATYTIINFEAVRLHQKELTQYWDVCVIDEAHHIKNRKAQVTKAVQQATKAAGRIIQLTGTPIINHASELFSLLHILFPKVYKSYWRFVDQYCTVYNNGYGWVVEDIMNAEDSRVIALQKLLSSFMLRRTKVQVMQSLPAKTIQQIPVSLTTEHRKLYDKMKTEMMVYLSQQKVVMASTILALITRLKQMAIDPTIMLDDETQPLSGSKVEAVHDLLVAAGDQKVVIFSQFARVIHRLQFNLAEWNIDFIGFTGQTAVKQREEALNLFRDDPQMKVFLTTIAAGGQGITLSTASIAIFIDKAWSPAYNVQAQDRLHRISQTKPVTIYEIIADNTVEQYIEKLLRHKNRVNELFLKDYFVVSSNLKHLESIGEDSEA